MATCRAEPLTTGNISRRLAAVYKVLRSIALQTPTNSNYVTNYLKCPCNNFIKGHFNQYFVNNNNNNNNNSHSELELNTLMNMQPMRRSVSPYVIDYFL